MAEAIEFGEPVFVADTATLDLSARSPLQLFWHRIRQDRLATASLIFIALLIIVAIAAPLLVDLVGTTDPNFRDQSALDPNFGTPFGPTSAHPFGVDQVGRDVFARTIYGARVSLTVAFLATGLSMLVGVVAGLLAGYLRGWTDVIISRTIDVILAIPYLLLAAGLAASCSLGDGCVGGLLKPGLPVVIFVIALTSWPPVARIVRGEALSIREREFVESARSVGTSETRIIFTEVLPNLVAPIIVNTSVLIPQVILYESALSYLGVGVSPSTPSWGQMLSDATGIFDTAWWYVLFPGLALLLTVVAFNLVGDALQDALNPRASRK